MPTVRLTKYQQRYLTEVWQGMPSKVRNQLTQESVRSIQVEPIHIAAAVAAIGAERARTSCKARCRNLDALASAFLESGSTRRCPAPVPGDAAGAF